MAVKTKWEKVHFNDDGLLKFFRLFLNNAMTKTNILMYIETAENNININKFNVFKPEPQTIGEVTDIDNLKMQIRNYENKVEDYTSGVKEMKKGVM